jgi:hypothetical protein
MNTDAKGNKLSKSTKCREILDKVKNYKFLKKDFAPWS